MTKQEPDSKEKVKTKLKAISQVADMLTIASPNQMETKPFEQSLEKLYSMITEVMAEYHFTEANSSNEVTPKEKSNALLEDLEEETGKDKEELIWEAVQLLWMDKYE